MSRFLRVGVSRDGRNLRPLFVQHWAGVGWEYCGYDRASAFGFGVLLCEWVSHSYYEGWRKEEDMAKNFLFTFPNSISTSLERPLLTMDVFDERMMWRRTPCSRILQYLPRKMK